MHALVLNWVSDIMARRISEGKQTKYVIFLSYSD